MEQWQAGLLDKRNAMKELTEKYFSNAWPALEFTLSVSKILNIYGCTLPFAGLILARSGGKKTLTSSMLIPWPDVYYTRNFTPKSWVSHNTSIEKDKLADVDMLPRIRFKTFITPDLTPMFTVDEKELVANIGLITSILDGKGHISDSGAHGQRGYYGNYMFVWVGAVVKIPYSVYKHLSHLGPKLYFFRLPFVEPTDEDLKACTNEDFERKRKEVQTAIIDYLIWWETCPQLIQDPETRLLKMKLDESKDESKVKDMLVHLVRLLGRLRCHVDIWPSKQPSDHEYSEYGYALPEPEDVTRAMQSLYNLTAGQALTFGRNYIIESDLHLALKVVLSTASKERTAVIDLLIANKGTVTLSHIAHALTMSKSTALKVMTELAAVKIVNLENVTISYNQTQQIRLRKDFQWILESDFLKLKGDYTPVNTEQYDRNSEQSYIPKDRKEIAFWTKYKELEAESSDGDTVDENALKNGLLEDYNHIFGTMQAVNNMIESMFKMGFIDTAGRSGYYKRTTIIDDYDDEASK